MLLIFNVSKVVNKTFKYPFEEINPKDLINIQSSYDFEKFDLNEFRGFIHNHFLWIYVSCFVYIITMFGIQKFMKNRTPFDLKKPLIIWNLALAVFSIVGAWKVIPELFYNYVQFGFHKMNCNRIEVSHSFVFWYSAFVISKFFEFGDTLFIVLRKRPLIFLHWYHHTSVFVASMYAMITMDPFTLIMPAVNYSVHSIMYSYFAAKMADIKISKFISIGITTIQLIQFIFGFGLIVYTCFMKYFDQSCHAADSLLKLILFVNISYTALFGHFFLKSYFPTQKKKIE